jgi:hypothetical protein
VLKLTYEYLSSQKKFLELCPLDPRGRRKAKGKEKGKGEMSRKGQKEGRERGGKGEGRERGEGEGGEMRLLRILNPGPLGRKLQP